MIKWFKSGSPWIWLTAGAVSLSLVAVLGLLLLIGYKGLSYFWPAPVYQFDVNLNGKPQVVIGELYQRTMVPVDQLADAGVDVSQFTEDSVPRYLIKTGNRGQGTLDFLTVLSTQIIHQQIANNIAVVDRESNGKFYGYPVSVIEGGEPQPLSQLTIPMMQVLDMWQPNNLSWLEKVQHWGHQVYKFLSEAPREANTEGGVFPAIFGTVFMVLLMSIMVTPLGVLAAVYLHEYASNNRFTNLIRIAVINLAGVPSIVYGVFGLGFFVYMVGGTIDDVFFSAQLPTPTFGTPGILWSALTLAIMTLPVVIVSTEEGLARIPSSVRNGSLALGATQAETLWRIVLPMASPAIMTGLILAVARAAGEVAPLMLVGVVKMAPTLPLDMHFPYVHLDRKFMHLGFHVYDVAFQSPNVEAARPLVYATSFLLVTVIISLNLTAIAIRNHLREKFRALEQ
jgi:phosphate ABC transporter permease subunit PstA